MTSRIPFGVRALALSHARAWPTAAWTGAATALAAGFDLPPARWLLLLGLVGICGSAVRITTAQLVGTWVAHTRSLDANGLDARLAPASPASDYDAATLDALRALTPPT